MSAHNPKAKTPAKSHTKCHGTVALITTPNFRDAHENDTVLQDFVYENLYPLCRHFDVLCTGSTYKLLSQIVEARLDQRAQQLVSQGSEIDVSRKSDQESWRRTINNSLTELRPGFPGMIEVAYRLVEKRLNAVIHMTDWRDLPAKPDTAVVWREANVHDVPIATDIETARAFIQAWRAAVPGLKGDDVLYTSSGYETSPLEGIDAGHRVLALIAHDRMKLDLCRFAVEYSQTIFDNFDVILATGTTGKWLREYMLARERSADEIKRIRLCLSGPYGGDVQIAYSVVSGLCKTVVFFQDPQSAHPHEVDIRLFEQAAIDPELSIRFATNRSGADLILPMKKSKK